MNYSFWQEDGLDVRSPVEGRVYRDSDVHAYNQIQEILKRFPPTPDCRSHITAAYIDYQPHARYHLPTLVPRWIGMIRTPRDRE